MSPSTFVKRGYSILMSTDKMDTEEEDATVKVQREFELLKKAFRKSQEDNLKLYCLAHRQEANF